jgi:hypothetical protein
METEPRGKRRRGESRAGLLNNAERSQVKEELSRVGERCKTSSYNFILVRNSVPNPTSCNSLAGCLEITRSDVLTPVNL